MLREDELLPANSRPHDAAESRDSAHEELVTLLAAIPSEEYARWRANKLPTQEVTGKKLGKKELDALQKQAALYPTELIDALQWDTARWKKPGWSQPPGSRWVQYRRTRQEKVVGHLRTRDSHDGASSDLVLLALTTESGNTSSLPTIARTLPQAELIHRSLVSRADRGQGSPPVLTGRAADGTPLEGHRHTHILPVDLDSDGHLDHILLWAPMGFSREALAAIRRLRKTWTKGQSSDLHVALAGHGKRETLSESKDLQDLLAPASVWKSATPFVPPRFLKVRGKNTLEGQIRSELAARALPNSADEVEIYAKLVPDPSDLPSTQLPHFRHFVRRRTRGGVAPPQDTGFFVELRFKQPIPGPICLGYGAHFGIGRFHSSSNPKQP